MVPVHTGGTIFDLKVCTGLCVNINIPSPPQTTYIQVDTSFQAQACLSGFLHPCYGGGEGESSEGEPAKPYDILSYDTAGDAVPPDKDTGGSTDKEALVEKFGTPSDVVNRHGQSYPRMVDPRTGEFVSFPENLQSTERADRVPWNSDLRGAYIKEWLDRGYPKPPHGWEPYDIHHILPREWSGTNDFENLVPLRRELHQLIVSPWWAGFEP